MFTESLQCLSFCSSRNLYIVSAATHLQCHAYILYIGVCGQKLNNCKTVKLFASALVFTNEHIVCLVCFGRFYEKTIHDLLESFLAHLFIQMHTHWMCRWIVCSFRKLYECMSVNEADRTYYFNVFSEYIVALECSVTYKHCSHEHISIHRKPIINNIQFYSLLSFFSVRRYSTYRKLLLFFIMYWKKRCWN